MEQSQLDIRDQQKASWDKFSPGWKKWDAFTMDFLKPMGDAMIQLLHPQVGDKVLDVATGTGEPGLTIAVMASRGSVTGTDLSTGMVNIANEHASARGISNYSAVAADVSELPFDDNSFDALSCRMGFMFFPDMTLAAKEMYRVLKPGGRMATAVWGVPDRNFWVTAMMGTLKKHIEMPAATPGGPSMFRCAAPGMLAGLLTAVGFLNVKEQLVEGAVNYDNPAHYWTVMNEMAAPVVAALAQTDDATIKRIKDDLFAQLKKRKKRTGVLHFLIQLLCYQVKNEVSNPDSIANSSFF